MVNMLKKIFQDQEKYIQYFFSHLNMEDVEKFVKICLECPGLLVFSGIGKSGIVAEKIAMTLISTGTKALHLPPTNFLHGDIGILTENDVIILLSRSGDTEELLNLIPFFKKRNAKCLAIVSKPNSRMAKLCDFSICLPLEKELCPFDLAPTTSTEIQLLFGDALAVALMKLKNFRLDDYALNHPSGNIGKKMSMTVEEIMIKGKDIPLCTPDDKLVDVLVELSNKKCGCLLVVDNQKSFLGIFTDGDLRRALQTRGPSVMETKMSDLMTVSALFIQRGSLAWDAKKLMQKDPKKWIMVLPVLEDRKAVGVIRMHDIVQAGLA